MRGDPPCTRSGSGSPSRRPTCSAGCPRATSARRLHGHGYTVEVEVTADALTGPGLVTDFGDLAPFGRYLDEHFDHRHLNEVLDVTSRRRRTWPRILHLVRRHLDPDIPGRVTAVRVSETREATWAEYRPGDRAVTARSTAGRRSCSGRHSRARGRRRASWPRSSVCPAARWPAPGATTPLDVGLAPVRPRSRRAPSRRLRRSARGRAASRPNWSSSLAASRSPSEPAWPGWPAATQAGHRVEIETSGTIAPVPSWCAAVSMFSVSPKLANAGCAH